MNKFKRKSLYLALAAGLGAVGVAGSASAVHVNPDGLGQALIYPYYTVRDAGGQYNTYLSVVNTTGSTKAVKVRFLEGKNSQEVLDFNVYLSPYDVWVASVEPVSADPAAGAQLVIPDNSCVVPSAKTKPFVNYAYAATNPDGEDATLDRTNEGYFEILEMANLTGTITTGIKHSNGVPVNCAALGPNEDESNVSDATVVGNGGLSGSATLINPATGSAYGYEPTVLDDWRQLFPVWSSAGSIAPDLSDVFPRISNLFDGRQAVRTTWNPAVNTMDAVSAVLMHDNVINEFVLDEVTTSGTDWVVTFPTKRAYVGLDTLTNGVRDDTAATRLFQSNFWTGGSCDTIVNTLHDREESSQQATVIPSPPPPGPQEDQLCWEANVLSFDNTLGGTSDILASTNGRTVSNTAKYQNGWMNMNIPVVSARHRLGAPADATTYNGVAEAQGNATTYFGLPVVGFSVQDYINNGVISTYGSRFNHKYTRNINSK
jgi:hypothetical protein